MTRRVLIMQADLASARSLRDFFLKQNDKVWLTSEAAKAKALLAKEDPTLAFIDLLLPGNTAIEILALIHRDHPNTQVVVTSTKPDLRLELVAKEQGARVFLRAPFTPAWIERALKKLDAQYPVAAGAILKNELPRVRFSMRLKITLPYVVLATIFVMVAAFLVSRYILETIQERFTNQLVNAGKQSADWMVQEENRILETVRLLAHTQGLAGQIVVQDIESLRATILPVAVNYQEDALEVLDLQGNSLLSLYRRPGASAQDYEITQGATLFANQDFTKKVLLSQSDDRGDKFAGLVDTPWGKTFYIAGPVFDADGKLVGAILVGKALPTLIRQMQQDILAQLTIYDSAGQPIASTHLMQLPINPLTLAAAQNVIQRQDQESPLRELSIASSNYSEILGPWEARGGQDLGIIGVSLAQNYLIRPSWVTSLQAFLIVILVFLGIILLGALTARQITQPLSQVVHASKAVADGNFQIKVPVSGNDEVMVLAHAFNYMVTGLQEGSIYRDLLGRTVSPQVREALRQSFASGSLRLEGHNTVATVLMSDVYNFTSLSEKEEPTTILTWLNEYFAELVPVIAKFGGVVDKFEGDAIMAFFGILPTPLTPEESAYHACQAAVGMLNVLEKINERRMARGEPPFKTGIGVNTGTLTAGGLGTTDRLNYTIIGDTVNTTQRMEGLTRSFGESGVVISENTLAALSGRRSEFRFEPLGEHAFRGKSELLWIYRLRPAINERRKAVETQPSVSSEAENTKTSHMAETEIEKNEGMILHEGQAA